MPNNCRGMGVRPEKPPKIVEAVARARMKRLSCSTIAEMFGWKTPATRQRMREWKKQYPKLFPALQGDDRISV